MQALTIFFLDSDAAADNLCTFGYPEIGHRRQTCDFEYSKVPKGKSDVWMQPQQYQLMPILKFYCLSNDSNRFALFAKQDPVGIASFWKPYLLSGSDKKKRPCWTEAFLINILCHFIYILSSVFKYPFRPSTHPSFHSYLRKILNRNKAAKSLKTLL